MSICCFTPQELASLKTLCFVVFICNNWHNPAIMLFTWMYSDFGSHWLICTEHSVGELHSSCTHFNPIRDRRRCLSTATIKGFFLRVWSTNVADFNENPDTVIISWTEVGIFYSWSNIWNSSSGKWYSLCISCMVDIWRQTSCHQGCSTLPIHIPCTYFH